MKTCLVICILTLSVSLVACVPRSSNPRSYDASAKQLRSVNGGSECVACTFVIGLVEQLSEIYNKTIVETVELMCSFLQPPVQTFCVDFAKYILPIFIEIIDKDDTADVICHKLTLCRTDKGQPECNLFPLPKGGIRARFQNALSKKQVFALPSICKLPGIKEICKLVEEAISHHEPAFDADKDGFSTYLTLRGISWRGKDCDDIDASVRPGASAVNNDISKDSNCNGIYGVDSASGIPYESLYCNGTGRRGIALVGDSVGAHFHIPEQWFDATQMSAEVFEPLVFVLENELDWPQLSSTSGYKNTSNTKVTPGLTDSLGYRLWKQNRCNHRDYQNLAFNGGASRNVFKYLSTLSRNQSTDPPMLVLIQLLGNDVCNGYPDTFAHMTTPEEMKTNMLNILQYLDTRLPAGSQVLLVGLAHGDELFDALHGRIHPLGRTNKDVTYDNYYDYLNCLQTSPCTGWMNTNGTVRNLTTQWAQNLSVVLSKVAAQNKTSFTHFDVNYIDSPIKDIFSQWVKQGGQLWQLIEPVDGFHINQLMQSMMGKALWEIIETKFPDMLGPINPHNADILRVFGDQGGFE